LPSGSYALAMAGGVLLHQLNYLDEVMLALLNQRHNSESRPGRWMIVEEPVRGAVALARLAAGS
jgi:hypothetical protein